MKKCFSLEAQLRMQNQQAQDYKEKIASGYL